MKSFSVLVLQVGIPLFFYFWNVFIIVKNLCFLIVLHVNCFWYAQLAWIWKHCYTPIFQNRMFLLWLALKQCFFTVIAKILVAKSFFKVRRILRRGWLWHVFWKVLVFKFFILLCVGKWILCSRYLVDSYRSKTWMHEEEYEWSNLRCTNEAKAKLAKVRYNWLA